MDATELELRRRISSLEEKVENLEDEYEFQERIRKILVEIGLIEAPEDK